MSAGRKNVNTKTDWNTPPKYVEVVKNFFDGVIDLDPCSNYNSTINATTEYILPTNGMDETWNFKNIYINPPYGRLGVYKMYDWLLKGKETFEKYDSELLYLIPVATNTKHFKDIIFKTKGGVCFLQDTRLKFWADGEEMAKGAPMSCCFIYFGNDFKRFLEYFESFGKCFEL